MTTTRQALNLSNNQVQKVIEDFISHLEVADIGFHDTVDGEKFGNGFILENYMASFD